jgi:membrane-bound ClpP family serine protease
MTGSGRIGVGLRKQGGFKFMTLLQVPLVQVLIALIVVGVLLWLVNNFIPMAGSIKSLLNAVVIIVVVVWLLNVFGLMHYITNFHFNRVG